MKVVYFYQYFGTPQGSWSTRVYELCRRWVASGHEVTVVTAPYEKSDIKAQGLISWQQLEGIELIVINAGDSNRLSILQRAIRALTFAFLAMYYALRLRYDVLIASSGPITIGLPLIIAKLIRRKPTVFEVRDLWPAGGIEMGLIQMEWQKRLALWFEKQCYYKADTVVSASTGQKAHIAKRFPKLNIEVIPNASDLEVFGNAAVDTLPEWAEGKKLYTHIGSLGFIHNMRYWMEVAQELKALPNTSNIIFIFIGDGSERSMLESLKAEWHLDNVVFLGLLPKSDLPVWVQHSVATLFATLDNPVQNTCSPNKVFDSFAAGVPIVQTSTGWIGHLVEKEYCGVNVPLKSPKSAAKTISSLAKHQETVKEMGVNARRLAETHFSREKLAQKYINILTNTL